MRRYGILVLVAMLALLNLSIGCAFLGVITGSGHLTTRSFDFTDFSRISAGYAFELEVTQATAYSISVTLDDNLSDYLRVDKKGDTLKLEMQSGRLYRTTNLRAIVSMPRLKELTLSGASRADVANFTAKDDLHLGFSGASRAGLTNILVNAFNLELSGASNLSGEVAADGNARLNLSGASHI